MLICLSIALLLKIKKRKELINSLGILELKVDRGIQRNLMVPGYQRQPNLQFKKDQKKKKTMVRSRNLLKGKYQYQNTP